tara:strand:- start:27674 stop:29173 length:1500 start_codon:yes stop_codon:yes gene_type:complete
MAGNFNQLPTFGLQPSASKIALSTNYITNFNFLSQYLPDTYEKEFERYGNRSISSFMRMVGAEMPCESDLIKWAEQGRLHVKYTSVGTAAVAGTDNVIFQVNDDLAAPGGIAAGVVTTKNIATTGGSLGTQLIAIRKGQTLLISFNNGAGINKGVVTKVGTADGLASDIRFEVALYEGNGLVDNGAGVANADCTVFVYGSEFAKGTAGMDGSLEGDSLIFENKPIILKDKYQVTGSDMTQIGWIEVSTENGATGYLWYMKSEHETRLRFDDYLETAMIEAVPAEAGSGAIAAAVNLLGSEGVFNAVETRGNVWAGGLPSTLADFDTVISRLDAQGAIEENVLFVNRELNFAIDDMLAAQNSYGAGGTSYGLFDNDEQMALNLGFSGFRRGYDFYKTDWKYLNDPTMRGGLAAGAGSVNGLLVPAGTTTVYDQVLGKNAKRPFLHVRYRASQTEDRRLKTFITGSAGGAATSDLDAMEVHFLSERAVCVMGANNFVIFED